MKNKKLNLTLLTLRSFIIEADKSEVKGGKPDTYPQACLNTELYPNTLDPQAQTCGLCAYTGPICTSEEQPCSDINHE